MVRTTPSIKTPRFGWIRGLQKSMRACFDHAEWTSGVWLSYALCVSLAVDCDVKIRRDLQRECNFASTVIEVVAFRGGLKRNGLALWRRLSPAHRTFLTPLKILFMRREFLRSKFFPGGQTL